jgi:hypothetical protein
VHLFVWDWVFWPRRSRGLKIGEDKRHFLAACKQIYKFTISIYVITYLHNLRGQDDYRFCRFHLGCLKTKQCLVKWRFFVKKPPIPPHLIINPISCKDMYLKNYREFLFGLVYFIIILLRRPCSNFIISR